MNDKFINAIKWGIKTLVELQQKQYIDLTSEENEMLQDLESIDFSKNNILKQCKYCGHFILNDLQRYCGNCGNRIDNIESDIMKKAISLWGINAQLDMLQEECAELIQTISKYKRNKPNNIPEEIADVMILITQISDYFQLHNQIELVRKEKINRLKNNLLGGE